MNLDSDAVIINQCDHYGYEEMEIRGHRVRFFSCAERGVGRSRNSAILRADRDICLFSDQDIVYEDGYERAVTEEFLSLIHIYQQPKLYSFHDSSSLSKNIRRIPIKGPVY